MKHDLILYILRFVDQDLIKVGITTDLRRRIDLLRSDFKNQFDLINSYVATGRKETIKILEAQILDDLKRDIPDSLPFDSGTTGSSEIRLSRNLPVIIKHIQNRMSINGDLTIFKGIDLSGFYSPNIPRDYYPHHEESSHYLSAIRNSIIELSKSRKVNPWVVINEILFEHFSASDSISPLVCDDQFPTENFYKVPHRRLIEDE